MGRTQFEMLVNCLVVLYLIAHGVSVPREGQADLVSGFYFSILAWLRGQAGWLDAVVKLGARPLQA